MTIHKAVAGQVFEERLLATISARHAFPPDLSERHFKNDYCRRIFSEMSECDAEWGAFDSATLTEWLRLKGWDFVAADVVATMLDSVCPFPASLVEHYYGVAVARAAARSDDSPDQRLLQEIAAMRSAGKRITGDMLQREAEAFRRVGSSVEVL